MYQTQRAICHGDDKAKEAPLKIKSRLLRSDVSCDWIANVNIIIDSVVIAGNLLQVDIVS